MTVGVGRTYIELQQAVSHIAVNIGFAGDTALSHQSIVSPHREFQTMGMALVFSDFYI